MTKPLFIVILLWLTIALSSATTADQIANQDLSSNAPEQAPGELAAQIETLKQALVQLNRNLFVLEEDLLFPSSTQVVVYLSTDVGEYFELDSVELTLNGQRINTYLYTQRQRQALNRGGVQRLHIGNISQGKHQLTAVYIGYGPEKREFKRAVSLDFEKDEDAATVELLIADSEAKQQPIFSAVLL